MLIDHLLGIDYGGKSVGFLTLFAPLVVLTVMWAWYSKILATEKKGVMPAVLIGIIGPLAVTVLVALAMVGIPACKDSPTIAILDCLSLLGLSVTIGVLSVLGYSGMLGAMALNLIASPLMGLWLAKKKV